MADANGTRVERNYVTDGKTSLRELPFDRYPAKSDDTVEDIVFPEVDAEVIHETLRQNYRDVKREAKDEFRRKKDSATGLYEKRLQQARQEMLRSTARCGEAFREAQRRAREEFDVALADAKEQYSFTVEIAKDQYKTEKKETRILLKNTAGQ